MVGSLADYQPGEEIKVVSEPAVLITGLITLHVVIASRHAKGLAKYFAVKRFSYIEVLFHILYYYWEKEYCSLILYRGLRRNDVR